MSQGLLYASIEPENASEANGSITNITLEAADGNLYAVLKIRAGDSVQYLHLTLTSVEGGDLQTRTNPDGRFLIDDPCEDYQYLEINGKRYHAYATPFQR